MAISAYTYANMNLNALNGVLGDLSAIGTTLKCVLLGNSYAPAQNRHDVFTADIWAATTPYSVGDYVIPTTATGHIYLCTSAGTSASAEPSWPIVDAGTIVDNDITWECVENGDLAYFEISGTGYTTSGQEITNKTLAQVAGVTTFDGDNVNWINSTLTARYAVVYETLTGILLSYQDFGVEKSSSSGNFEIQWNVDGIATITATQAV